MGILMSILSMKYPFITKVVIIVFEREIIQLD